MMTYLKDLKSRMRIGIDNISPGLSTSQSALGGMRHFMQSLVSVLPAAGRAHQFELFSPEWADAFEMPAASNLACVPYLRVPRNRYARALYEQTRLPLRIRQRGVSVWLGTCNTLPLLAPCRTVLIVQSVQYYSHPEAYRWSRRIYLTQMLRLSLGRADRIVAFSQASKTQLVQWFGIEPGRIRMIHHAFRFSPPASEPGADEQQEVYASTGGPYILCVSAFYPYKNLQRLVEAYASLRKTHAYRLVLVGAPTEFLTQRDIMAVAGQWGVERDVLCLGRVPDAQLVMLYRYAALMAMPSLDETFGLPVLEAMALGCPVVTSNLSSMPEIAGAAAILVDPYQIESIVDGMRDVLENSARRNSLIEAGKAQAGVFTYERFFHELMDVLEETGSAAASEPHLRKTVS